MTNSDNDRRRARRPRRTVSPRRDDSLIDLLVERIVEGMVALWRVLARLWSVRPRRAVAGPVRQPPPLPRKGWPPEPGW